MLKRLTRLPYIITYLCAFVLGMKQLREPDIWWQLLSGRWMLDNGAVTRTDVFSYTMAGTPWVNVKWLYEVWIAFLEKGLGPHGVMLLQALVNVAIVYLLLRLMLFLTRHIGRQMSTLYSVVAALLFLVASEFRMAGRPEMISHLLTVVYIFILWRSDNYNWKRILWLIPLQCLWANMHEGYPVGMVITGVYAAGGLLAYAMSKNRSYLQAAGRLSAVWAGMAIAILANPNTIQLWKQPFEIFRQLKVNKYTTELYSIANPEYWTMQAKIHVALFTAVCLFWIWKMVTNKKSKQPVSFTPAMVGYLILVPVFGYLSFTANRNIPFAQMAIIPSVPLLFTWLAARLKISAASFYRVAAKRTVLISTLIAAIFYVTVVSNAFYIKTGSVNRYGLHVNTLHNPTAAAEFLKKYKPKGPAFSDYFVSSYLLWSLYPDFKSYIDLRDLDIFSADFFEDYFDLYNHPRKFYDLDSTYKFNYIVLSTSQLTGLQQYLYWGENFNVVYIDPVSVVMVRHNDENDYISNSPEAQNLFAWPQDPLDPGWADALTHILNPKVSYEEEDISNQPLYAGKYYNGVRNYRIALRFLLPAVQTDFSDDADALTTIGQSYVGYTNFTQDPEVKAQRLDSARIYFERSLQIDPNHKEAYPGLAGICFEKGLYPLAHDYLEKYIALDHTNDYVYFLNGLCIRNMVTNKLGGYAYEDVITNMEHCVQLNPNNTKVYLYLAEAYSAIGNKDKARTNIKKTLGRQMPLAPYEQKLYDKLKKELGVTEIENPQDLKEASGIQ